MPLVPQGLQMHSTDWVGEVGQAGNMRGQWGEHICGTQIGVHEVKGRCLCGNPRLWECNQGCGAQPRCECDLRVWPVWASKGGQGFPGTSNMAAVCWSISQSSQMVYTTSHCALVPRGHAQASTLCSFPWHHPTHSQKDLSFSLWFLLLLRSLWNPSGSLRKVKEFKEYVYILFQREENLQYFLLATVEFYYLFI